MVSVLVTEDRFATEPLRKDTDGKETKDPKYAPPTLLRKMVAAG